AMLYGKRDLLLGLPGFNHDFIPADSVPYKFQPGGANYELSYSTLGISDYLCTLAQQMALDPALNLADLADRTLLQTAFDAISRHEEQLSARMLEFLESQPGVRIVGDRTPQQQRRVPTIAFTVVGVDSGMIPPQVDHHQIGIRYGDFYAKQLIRDLGLTEQNGVVRISLVHYNTLEECDRLISVLEPILAPAA
ncbi:cysteine desulfurase-like protein, partial [filamentous cyanobacterium CCP5]